LIREYFNKRHTYDAIRDMLSIHHDIEMSCGTLKARLKDLGLRKRGATQRQLKTEGLLRPGQLFVP